MSKSLIILVKSFLAAFYSSHCLWYSVTLHRVLLEIFRMFVCLPSAWSSSSRRMQVSSDKRFSLSKRTSSVWPDWAIFKSYLASRFLTKVAQTLGDFLGFFETHLYVSKAVVVTFRVSFGKFWLLFISTSGHTAHLAKIFVHGSAFTFGNVSPVLKWRQAPHLELV